MGLDISLYRPIPLGDDNPQDIENFKVLSDYPTLSIFNHLSFERENGYYDLESEFLSMGLNIEDYQWYLTDYGYDDGEGTQIFDEIFGIDTTSLNLDDYMFETIELVYRFKRKTDENESVILINPPIIYKTEKVITCELVNEQRKGANKQFYEDGMWDSPPVVDKKTLINHWKKYFSKNTPESKGGFGSGVEYELTDKEMKQRFKKNIIDKFVEGEMFVIYN